MKLLVLFESIAKTIKPYQKVSNFIAIFVIIAILAILSIQERNVAKEVNSGYGTLLLLSTIWLLLVNLMTTVFSDISHNISDSDSLFKRLKLKLIRSLYFILALFFTLLSLAVIILTIRLLKL